MIKSSKPASSGVEPHFHDLLDNKTDLSSSIRSEKLEKSIMSGGSYVSTETYLKQVEAKYEKLA
jgi:hypothetical protein